MNYFFLSLFTLLLTASPVVPLSSYSDKPVGSTQSVNGIIIMDDMESVEIWPVKEKSKTILLKIKPESYIADAVSGKPASLSERKDDKVVAYYKTDGTGENYAIALIINIPEDFSPPVYARASQVSRMGEQLYVLTDSGIIVTISGDTPVEPFLTRNIVTADNISDNTDLLLWNQAYNMSIPARTAANKAVILGKAKPDDPIRIIDRDLQNSTSWQGGNFPEIIGIQNADLQNSINDMLDNIYNDALGSRINITDKLVFSYNVKKYNRVTSVIIHICLSSGSTEGDDVRTVVFNEEGLITLVDVLGDGAYEKADGFVRRKIENEGAGRFFEQENGFKYVTDTTSFYVDTDGDPVFIFNKYSIAPGVFGTPEFKMNK